VKRGKRRGTREKETDSGLGLPDSGRDEPQGWPLRGRDNNAVTKKGCRIPASGVGKKTEDGKEGLRESGFGSRASGIGKGKAASLKPQGWDADSMKARVFFENRNAYFSLHHIAGCSSHRTTSYGLMRPIPIRNKDGLRF